MKDNTKCIKMDKTKSMMPRAGFVTGFVGGSRNMGIVARWV